MFLVCGLQAQVPGISITTEFPPVFHHRCWMICCTRLFRMCTANCLPCSVSCVCGLQARVPGVSITTDFPPVFLNRCLMICHPRSSRMCTASCPHCSVLCMRTLRKARWAWVWLNARHTRSQQTCKPWTSLHSVVAFLHHHENLIQPRRSEAEVNIQS